ncbi:MAG: arylamine N-acetyltransferase [Lapillicoccus sp.]
MDNNTAAYLNRLGVDAERPSAEALARLHRAHVERVPYETFWIHLAQEWGIDPGESTRRVATTRRGGYCYQLNGAFQTLLTSLGYQVSVNVAGVHEQAGPAVSTLRNHAALVVEGLPCETNPGGRWWVDAGLGDALHDPMPLIDSVVAQGPMRFGMTAVGAGGVGDWHLTHDPSGSFTGVSLVDEPVSMDVFAARHVYNSTSQQSGFAKTVTAQRRHAQGTSLVRGCVYTRTDGDVVTAHTCESLHEWLDVLEGEFDLAFSDVPAPALAGLWTSVRRTHDVWAQSRKSA